VQLDYKRFTVFKPGTTTNQFSHYMEWSTCWLDVSQANQFTKKLTTIPIEHFCKCNFL